MFKLITPTITNCECSMRNVKNKKKTEYMSLDDLTQFTVFEDG